MPMRTITLPDGTTATREIINIHPDGTEFLPEEFEITGDTPEGRRILLLARDIIIAGLEREERQRREAEKQSEKK